MTPNDGWFKTFRSLFRHPLFAGDVACRGYAFNDLVGMAEFEDAVKGYKGELIQVKRGEFIASVRFLAERWRWGKGRVQRFMARLEVERMVIPLSETPIGTLYRVVNYDVYQGGRDSLRDTKRDTDGTPTGQIEEEKNLTNDLSINNARARSEMEQAANAHAETIPMGPDRKAFNADVRGVVTGDSGVSWRIQATGESVPWEERPVLFRLALDELAKGRTKQIHWALQAAIARQYDPLTISTAAEIKERRLTVEKPIDVPKGLRIKGPVEEWAEENPESYAELEAEIRASFERQPWWTKHKEKQETIAKAVETEVWERIRAGAAA